jgi:membrane protease YdiL (CAAX protease family)
MLVSEIVDERAAFFLATVLHALVLGGVPIVVARRELRAFGISLGATLRWRRDLALALPFVVPVALVTSRLPGAHALYPRFAPAKTSVSMFAAATLASGAQHAGWEVLFRGLLLFALARRWGAVAIVLQAVPFALTHLPKGLAETVVALPGGALLGWIAWRARSFVPAFLLHWTLATAVNVAVVLWP